MWHSGSQAGLGAAEETPDLDSFHVAQTQAPPSPPLSYPGGLPCVDGIHRLLLSGFWWDSDHGRHQQKTGGREGRELGTMTPVLRLPSRSS